MPEMDPGSPHVDVAGYLLGTLTRQEREAFEGHLATCASCQHELEELRGLPGLLAEAPEPVAAPPGLEARVLGAIAREPARRGSRPAPVIRLEPRRSGSRWRTAWAGLGAAAVAAAFLGGIGLDRVLAPANRPAPPQPALQTISLVAANGGSATGAATVRAAGGGRTIELTVRNLPSPPPGHFYTCWLVATDDTPQHQDRVSVGSFTTSGTGPLTLRWETAADLARYPNLGVTLEPDDGNPLRQGPKVLTAR